MAWNRFSLAFLALTFSVSLFAESLEFKRLGGVVTTLSLAQMTKAVTPITISYDEPHENKLRKYKAVSFKKLLEFAYGPRIIDADEVLFTCADGFKPSVSLSELRERSSFLIFAADDGLPFEFPDPKKGGPVPYGPFYLVWEPSVKKNEGYHENSPYQVVSIDLIRFKDHFPNLAPPEKVGSAASRGFMLYRKYCLQCHLLNGEGGGKGPELNYPINVTEYFKEPFLSRWILDPASVRHNAQMFGFDSKHPNREKAVRDIVSYLRAMSKRKIAPKPSSQ